MDDLEAVRIIVEALKPFPSEEQERILRWAREKAGLKQETARTAVTSAPQAPRADDARPNDIWQFVAHKQPQNDTQFVATVAYYHRFEAPEPDRKEAISSADVTEACRKADWTRLARPAQTLVNAANQGLLDRADRGMYRINAVGENLVAMTLPSGGRTTEGTISSPAGRRARKRPARPVRKTRKARRKG
jgi:hypothetical protein